MNNTGVRDGNLARRILIDALAARFGGTAFAAIQLAHHLAARPNVDVVVVTRQGSLVSRGLSCTPSVDLIGLRTARRLELLRRTVWETLLLPRLAQSVECDLIVSYSGILLRRPGPAVLCHLLNPVALLDSGFQNRLRRMGMRRTAKWATQVAAPSEGMRSLVARQLNRDVRLIPLGVDHDRFHPAESPGNDLLCVADFYSHKRHSLLIAAWQHLDPPRPRLRLIGNPAVDPANFESVKAAAQAHPGEIVIEHDLSLSNLCEAYRAARAFVLPSVRESFCMPLAESLASGVPGVVSDLESLHFTGGKACRFVPVSASDAAWAASIRSVIGGGAAYTNLRQEALSHSRQFSWKRMTDEILAVEAK